MDLTAAALVDALIVTIDSEEVGVAAVEDSVAVTSTGTDKNNSRV